MARNGAGTYTLPAGNPVTTGTTISSSWANSTLNDIASGLTTSLAYDGQTAPVANLPMATYAHTNVGNATLRTMYAAAGQVQDGTLTYLTSVSGTDTITAIAPISMSAYATGQTFRFIAAGANTTTSVTLNINSIGAKNITKNGTTALIAGDIPSGSVVIVTYDGTQFQISNLSPSAFVSSFTAGTTGLTPSTATSGAVTLAGTLSAANGGTGAATLGTGNLVVGNATSAVTTIAPVSNGRTLIVTAGSSVTAGAFVIGATYTITSVGTTNFTSIGASANTVGLSFTATGVGTGTGTATLNTWSTGSALVSRAVQSVSGTSVSFTDIPSWVKRITVMFANIGYTSTEPVIQLGTSSGLVTTGYIGTAAGLLGTGTQSTSVTTGLKPYTTSGYYGVATFTLQDNNTWFGTYMGSYSSASGINFASTYIALGGTLTQLALVNTSSMTSGTMNIMYE